MFYVDNFNNYEYEAIEFLKHDTNTPAYVDDFYLIDDLNSNTQITNISDPLECKLCNVFTQHLSTLINLGIKTGTNARRFLFYFNPKTIKTIAVKSLLYNSKPSALKNFYMSEIKEFESEIVGTLEKDERPELYQYIFKKDLKQFFDIFDDIYEKYRPHKFRLLKNMSKIFEHLGD